MTFQKDAFGHAWQSRRAAPKALIAGGHAACHASAPVGYGARPAISLPPRDPALDDYRDRASAISGRKIFNISLHRSGTQSLNRFLLDAGIAARHWPRSDNSVNYEDFAIGHETDSKHLADILAPIINGCAAIGDVPIPAIYEELSARWPRARFIAVFRSPFDWLKSVRRHVGERALDPYERCLYWRYFSHRPRHLHEISDADLLAMHLRHHAGMFDFFAESPNFLLVDINSASSGREISRFLGIAERELGHVDYLQPATTRMRSRAAATIAQAAKAAPSLRAPAKGWPWRWLARFAVSVLKRTVRMPVPRA